jgi:hypothetical protein
VNGIDWCRVNGCDWGFGGGVDDLDLSRCGALVGAVDPIGLMPYR